VTWRVTSCTAVVLQGSLGQAGVAGRAGECGKPNATNLPFRDGFLVGGLEHFLFSPIVGMMIQSDEYFSEGLKPPTSFNRTHLW